MTNTALDYEMERYCRKTEAEAIKFGRLHKEGYLERSGLKVGVQ